MTLRATIGLALLALSIDVQGGAAGDGARPQGALEHVTTAGPVAPPAAARAGYTQLTFSTQVFSASSVDLLQTQASGFQWYPWNFFSQKTDPAGITIHKDGSVSVSGVNGNGQLASAAAVAGSQRFVGQAFGGGGYFEATLRFMPDQVAPAEGWPSWWTMAVEHLALLGEAQWATQPRDYVHFIEADIFEYNKPKGLVYTSTLHEWYGKYQTTCKGFCDVQSSSYIKRAPDGTDWTQYHRFGMLWVPATPKAEGSVSFYMDGVQQGPAITFAQFTGQPPPPTRASPWLYGIVDRQHLVLVLGSGRRAPMTVQSVNVWQASGAANLTH